jgi:uncharacterized membrane protein
MEKFKKVIEWIVVSSENPQNVSLTMRGLMIAFIPTIMMLVPLVTTVFGIHLSITSESLTSIVNDIVSLSTIALTVVGTCISGYGLVRKIINQIYDTVHPTA